MSDSRQCEAIAAVLTPLLQAAGIAPESRVLSAYTALSDLVLCGIKRQHGGPVLLGVCGAQGSGKSTLGRVLQQALGEGASLSVALLSLDDLYLPSSERQRLAAQVHPLLRTRGVPGTHDVGLGLDVLARLLGREGATKVRLPRFDKLRDEPWPLELWPVLSAPVDVVLFEGWCVGARAQSPEALIEPLNELERDEDADGRWRRHVNAMLEGPYAALFGLIDALVMLRAPNFEVVYRWRAEQERALAHAAAGATGQAMPEPVLRRFIQHYERLTRHLLAEMPARADVVIELDEQRHVRHLVRR